MRLSPCGDNLGKSGILCRLRFAFTIKERRHADIGGASAPPEWVLAPLPLRAALHRRSWARFGGAHFWMGFPNEQFPWERDYRAGERALNLSDSSSALDVCPHLEHW